MARRGGSGKVKKVKHNKAKYQVRAGLPKGKGKKPARGGVLGPGTHKATWRRGW